MFKTIIGSIGIAAIILLAIFILIYNKLVRIKNLVHEAWSGIDIQLKRRYDLIPNLVATVKGYSTHESNTLERITQLRTIAMSAGSFHDKSIAENNLTTGLKALFAVAENYPDLKASHNFASLQAELSNIEEQLQLARRYYNAVTRDYNSAIQVFPSNLVANFLNYKPQSFFELSHDFERQTPNVSF